MPSSPNPAVAVALAVSLLSANAPAQCTSPPQWQALTASTEAVDCVALDGAGGLYAGGTFAAIGGVAASRIARWNGTAWSPLGSGMAGGITSVSALLHSAGGQLYAAGTFTSAGGVAANHIARWNGSTWSALGSGITGFGVFRLAELPNGDIVALGNFTAAGGVPATNIARWNGTAWFALGSGLQSPGGMLVRGNGDLVVGGTFPGLTGTIARWSGTAWQALGSFASMVPNGFAELRNGDLLAAGYQTVQRWNGSAWTQVGALSGGNLTTGYDVARLADGSALVVGSFTTVTSGTATAVRGVARFEPSLSTWSDFASTTQLASLGNAGRVGRAQARADGSVLLYQSPALASGTVASVLAVSPGCPANAVASGSGCAGSAGVHVLTAPTLPWLGTAMTGSCSGVPAGALGVAVWGLAPLNVPLASVLPTAAPGCTGQVLPELLIPAAPASGAVTASLALPVDPALVGGQILLQVLVLDAAGLATTSNTLTFTIGRP